MLTTLGLAIFWLDNRTIGSGSLFGFCSGRSFSIWLLVLIINFSITISSSSGQTNFKFQNIAKPCSLDTLTGNFVYNTGATEELELPDGVKLSVGATSSEAKLVAFLSNAKMLVDSVDKTNGWISLDRLYFETGKSTLTASSQTQLKNIAAILKAYPNVALKMGGYTDNTGSADGNLKLSESRATSAMASLVAAGTTASRLAAEGYGQEHPIADNATAEGRALNRRIDVRVTKK